MISLKYFANILLAILQEESDSKFQIRPNLDKKLIITSLPDLSTILKIDFYREENLH